MPRPQIVSVLMSILASVTVLAVGPPAAAQSVDCTTEGDDACESWAVELTEEPGYPSTFPVSILAHPEAPLVVAIGYERSGSDPFESTARGWVAARSAATGENLWRATLSPGPYLTLADAAMSPAGDFIVVTGKLSESFLAEAGLYAAALSTQDGALLWEKILPQPSIGRQVAVAPDGTAVVTGFSGRVGGAQLIALALDGTGDPDWFVQWQGPGGEDIPEGLAISSDGRQAIVAVSSKGTGSPYDEDFATLALALKAGPKGRVVWETRYDYSGVGAQDRPRALAVSPDGSTAYVTGYSNATTEGPPYAADYDAVTLAYDTKKGDLLWESRYRPSGATFSPPRDLVASEDAVALTLSAPEEGGSGTDIVTVALDPFSGREVWSARLATFRHDSEIPNALTMSSDGASVILTGASSSSDSSPVYLNQGQNGDQATLAYDVLSGDRLWAARYRAGDFDRDSGAGVAPGPQGGVYTVVGLRRNLDLEEDFNDVGMTAYLP